MLWVTSYWLWAVRGSTTLTDLNAATTKPEQSKPSGPFPPHRYGTPIADAAVAITVARCAESPGASANAVATARIIVADD